MEGLRRCESDALRCGTVGCVAMRYYAGDVEVETSRVSHDQKRNGNRAETDEQCRKLAEILSKIGRKWIPGARRNTNFGTLARPAAVGPAFARPKRTRSRGGEKTY